MGGFTGKLGAEVGFGPNGRNLNVIPIVNYHSPHAPVALQSVFPAVPGAEIAALGERRQRPTIVVMLGHIKASDICELRRRTMSNCCYQEVTALGLCANK
jgi:hypothetical protein